MKSTKLLRTWSIAFACFAALMATACGSTEPAPTSPTPVTQPTPTPTPTPPPPPPSTPKTGRIEIEIKPNPVPFSGQPITDASSCANSPNTWFYEQILKETGGAEVTITGRVDKFDGRVVNTRNDLDIKVPANGSTTLNSRWCSAQAVAHTAQTSFSGKDASGNSINVDGPTVQLQSR